MVIHDVVQGSEEWFGLRAGIPTASEASKLVTSTGKESKQMIDYAYQLAGELYAGKPLDRWDGNEWTDRGKEMEAVAMTTYELNNCVWVQRVGFCTVGDGSYGCSPDGLADDGNGIDDDGMVEIKCLAAKNHVRNMVYYNKHKKAMPEYIPQVQMQLLVCDRKWCDLVFYHPELPMLVIRQEQISEVLATLRIQINSCLKLRDDTLKIIEEGINAESK